MKIIEKLKLNEKLYFIALITEDLNDGIGAFFPNEIGFNNVIEVSKILYIISNFIIGKRSYKISEKLKDGVINKKVFNAYKEYKSLIDNDKLMVLEKSYSFLSKDKDLKNLGFIDKIREDYSYSDLALDISKYVQR